MFLYRKKFLLAIIEAFGGSIDSLKFQKYLFLISKCLSKRYYSFIPYHYGCFSFESYNDKRSLINSGHLLENNNKWITHKNNNFLSEINSQDKEYILNIKKKYGRASKQNLLHKIYSEYPYYAINSRIVQKVNLSTKEQKTIASKKPRQTKKCLFTIGYEGRSIDEYLNLLIKNNIKVLCDVRKNPLSRKYGFSKKVLQKNLAQLSIQYFHIPGLGISSHLRKDLETEQDYKKLFSTYKKEILPFGRSDLEHILNYLNNKKRIALTCFEVEPEKCHRHCISSILQKKNHNLITKHL